MKHLRTHFAAALTASSLAAQIPVPKDAPSPLSPEQSAAAFVVPAGFRMELVASEPLIASPSGVCWDERGRLFVSELHGYNLEGQLDIEALNRTGRLDTQVRRVEAAEEFKHAARQRSRGVVKLLTDTDGDGRMDKAQVWADDLPPAYGLVPARGGVIIACAPDIIYLADRDGDGRAETREVLFKGFPIGALERGINAPQWGPDGWIYFGRGWGGGTISGPKLAKPVPLPHSDFRIRPDGSAIEPVTGGTGTFGFAMTDTGDRFVVAAGVPAYAVAPLPWPYLARNPDAAASGLQVATGDRRAYPLAPPHPWRTRRESDPAFSKFYRERYGASESDASGWITSACGPLVYRDYALPGLHGHYFVCEPAGSLIRRERIRAEGSVPVLGRVPGEERSEFIASRDPWSHPISLSHGPDGAIWVVDYYREIIEDYSAIPRHLQQQYGLYAGHDRGRIYRLTHRDMPSAPDATMSILSPAKLARELASPLFWRRATAQRMLAEKPAAPETTAAIRAMLAAPASSPVAIVAALRTLDDVRALQMRDVAPFVAHSDAAVRVHALQLADRWLKDAAGHLLLEAILERGTRENDPRVLLQLALTLGEAPDPRAFRALVHFAREHIGIRWMESALLSGLHQRAVPMLAELLPGSESNAAFLAALAQAVGASRDQDKLARSLALIATGAAPEIQAKLVAALAKGRKDAPHVPLGSAQGKASLAQLEASARPEVRSAAKALAQTFGAGTSAGTLPDQPKLARGELQVSEERFGEFVAGLATERNVRDGHHVFQRACAACHRVAGEGFELGPDLIAEAGAAEETLLRHILLPNERIRPGFETTAVDTAAGDRVVGLQRDQTPTSLTLALPGGVEQVLLRRDIAQVSQLPISLMPSFGDALTPAEAAHLIAWLKSHLASPASTPLPRKG